MNIESLPGAGFSEQNVQANLGIGILEVESFDENGQVQQVVFGSLYDFLGYVGWETNMPTRLFVSKMLSVTVALISNNSYMFGTVTLFHLG